METDIPELKVVAYDLMAGRTAKPVTIRNFLSWFGAQRRTTLNVEYINGELSKCDLQTVPSYLNIWVDTPITFELVSQKGKRDDEVFENSIESPSGEDGMEPDQSQEKPTPNDPSFRIGKLKAATRTPISVRPNDPISKAMTIMMTRNFWQIPVMTNEREVKGVVSWASIGERHVAGQIGSEVRHCMSDHYEIKISASLFAAIQIISEHNYVLVRNVDQRISGIITANDIAAQFEETSTPFLRLSEIENHLRALIDGKLSADDVKATCDEQHLPRNFSKISDLTFGNYVNIFDHPDNWSKIGLRLDKASFVGEIKEVNRIRNEVMHFDPDPLEDEDLSKLRDVARLFDTIKRLQSS